MIHNRQCLVNYLLVVGSNTLQAMSGQISSGSGRRYVIGGAISGQISSGSGRRYVM